VAEGARLESVFRGNSNLGSNPSLSASIACSSRSLRSPERFRPRIDPLDFQDLANELVAVFLRVAGRMGFLRLRRCEMQVCAASNENLGLGFFENCVEAALTLLRTADIG
jgi:hypothetical protein